MTRSESQSPCVPSLRRRVAKPLLIGVLLIGLFAGGFSAWSAMAPLSAAAIATGVISPEGSRRVVQHLEGGIIREILVGEGDMVTAGEPVIILEETIARASFAANEAQWWRLSVALNRIAALQKRADEIAFSEDILARANEDADLAHFIETQKRLFRSTMESHEGQGRIYAKQVAQLGEEISGREGEISGIDRQIALIGEEIVDVQQLLERDLARKTRLLNLQREEARLETLRASSVAAIATANQQIGEIELAMLNSDATLDQRLAEEQTQVSRQLADYAERMAASGDVLSRTEILAPVSGTVVAMRFKTIGGVVGPGEPLLDIVPTEDALVIDARLSPIDIDVVHNGLVAQVHLLPYVQRYTAPLSGTVTRVGADGLTDEQTGERYYQVQISVDREQLNALGDAMTLTSGMPAEIFIVTGERTFMEYFTEPIIKSFRRSFRET